MTAGEGPRCLCDRALRRSGTPAARSSTISIRLLALLVGKARHFVGKARHFVGKARHFVGKARHFVGKAHHFVGEAGNFRGVRALSTSRATRVIGECLCTNSTLLSGRMAHKKRGLWLVPRGRTRRGLKAEDVEIPSGDPLSRPKPHASVVRISPSGVP
jgi:hypothetical protein